jgi:transcriptional regulator with XRE-family HTH domain
VTEIHDLSLGAYVRELRSRRQLTLLDLSTSTKIAYTHLSRIENESTIPNPETIVKLAHALDGDLTLMLQKANNLPRVILDRLIERDKAVRVQTLRRSIPGASHDPADVAEEALNRAVEEANLSEQDVADLSDAIKGLVMLRPQARRAIIQLIGILHDDEADGEQG